MSDICSPNLQGRVVSKLETKLENGSFSSWENALEYVRSLLGNDYNLKKIKEEFTESSYNRIEKVFKRLNYNFNASDPQIRKKVISKKVSNVKSIFNSPLIVDLFSDYHVAKKYFEKRLNQQFVEAVIFNPEEDEKGNPIETYVRGDFDVNNNIKSLKNKLFKTIVDYLKELGKIDNISKYYKEDKFIANLYDFRGNFKNYDLYKDTLKILEETLLGKNNVNAVVNIFDQIIPDLTGSISNINDRLKLDAYNAAILLVNFDNILYKYYNNVIKIDVKYFNDFNYGGSSSKYSLTPKGKSTEYWKTEEHMSESVEEIRDQLSDAIIESIPLLDNNGDFTGLYLDRKDLYSLAAFIKNFEILNFNKLIKLRDDDFSKLGDTKDTHPFGFENWTLFSKDPLRMLKWYIHNILEAKDGDNWVSEDSLYNNRNAVTFNNKIGVLRSLDSFLTKNATKEKNSKRSILNIVSQVVNNSYGANYTVYNQNTGKLELQEMHSHNATRVDLQNSIYSYLSQRTTLPNQFWIGVSSTSENAAKESENIKKEIENIKKQTDTPQKLSNMIYAKLGIYLGPEGAFKLMEALKDPKFNEGENKEKVARYVRDFLVSIRQSEEEGQKGILEAIQENEENIADLTKAEVKSKSEVISKLSQKIQDILDIFLENQPMKAIMVTTTSTGEKIPTFKLANLMFDDGNVLLERHLLEQTGSEQYRNLFLQDGGLLGTSTKLEAINEDKSKTAFNWTALESFTASFEYDFLDVFRPTSKVGGINVMIGNYSDKNSIVNKIIDKNIKHNGEYIIGNNSGKNVMTQTNLLELVRTQSYNYYWDVVRNIFDQYSKLGVKISNVNVANPDIKIIKSNIKKINDFLKEFKTLNDLLEHIRTKRLNDDSINISGELHYSIYVSPEDGKSIRLGLNQPIIDNFFIFENKDNFNHFVKESENSLINKLIKYSNSEYLFSSGDLDKMEEKDLSLNSLLTTFGIDKKSFQTNFVVKGEGVLIKSKTGLLNPLLKRGLWVNNLFKHEYLYITTKPEYMHPFKSKDKESKLKFRGDNFIDSKFLSDKDIKKGDIDKNKLHWTEYFKEMSFRLPNMSKRNVSFTATYEIPIKNYQLGVPDKINGAIIQDRSAKLGNLSGKTHTQDIHDGSTWINYAYSRMIEESFPSKSYQGTKKEIGTFISPYGSSLKKDAEFVITNEVIRDSSKSEVNMLNKQDQMLSAFDLPSDLEYTSKELPFIGFYKNGNYYKINNYAISKGKIVILGNSYNPDTKQFNGILSKPIVETEVKNLFDIWKAFGGADTITEDLEFSEGSNDLIYDLVTSYVDNDGKYILKDKMIHFISNGSSFKSGQINLNPSRLWESNERLTYTTFKNDYIGPQLDANHSANESKIKEITQIISALAQNPTTAYLANEVYQDIARIIKESSKKYYSSSDNLTEKQINDFYTVLSKQFAYNLANSEGTTLAKTIAETFGIGQLLPFSNQHFFRDFTREMITKMNNEFITRYYPGLGAVINPSHGIVQLYQGKDGKIYKQSELRKLAFKWGTSLPDVKVLSNNQILDKYLETFFPNDNITVGEVNLWDTILIDGKPVTLNTLEKYYNFKTNVNSLSDQVVKIYNAPRDLKPDETTFTVNGIYYNKFDLDSVKLRFVLNTFQENFKKADKDKTFINPKYLQHLTSFAEWAKIPLNGTDESFDKLDKKLNAWTKRNTQLLDSGRIMIPRTNSNLPIDFNIYFPQGDNLSTPWENAKKLYNELNTVRVENYNHIPAEVILPKIYSAFDIKGKSINEVTGPEYFIEQLESNFKEDDTNADLKFVLSEGNPNVYIKFVHDLPIEQDNLKLFVSKTNDETGETELRRISSTGGTLYTKPKNSKVVHKNGVDIIYVKISKEVKVVDEATNKTNKFRQLNVNLQYSLWNFIRSFDEDISAIVPLLNNDNKDLITNTINRNNQPININEETFKIFSKFYNYRKRDSDVLDSSWLSKNIQTVLQTLSNKKFASWQKSLETISARIPAQSMQSFMTMKNVAYFNTESNDAYVSIFQIWYQGSDFDIDKSYMMGYGFNKNGHYEVGTPLFDYSTKEELDILERIPLPNGKEITVDSGSNIDNVDTEISNFIQFIESNNITETDPEKLSSMFPLSIIRDFISVLRKSNNNDDKQTNNTLVVNQNLYANNSKIIDLYINIINKHNTSTEYIYKRNAIRNSIVSKIKEIISTPSNFLFASEPISIDSIHKAAEAAKEQLKYTEDLLSNWDWISPFKQQEDASVGKADVGIGANGQKVFLALSNYYNNWYTHLYKNDVLIDKEAINFYNDNKVFRKEFTINGNKKLIHTIANTNVSQEYMNTIFNIYGYDELQQQLSEIDVEIQAALEISGIISAATDNAKELVMSKINAVVELASMHLYLMSLGYGIKDVALYMNSPIGKYISNNIRGNIFKSSKSVYVDALLTKYLQENEGQEEEVKQFREIYEGAQEFKFLAQILKVNQKTAANVDELNRFLSNLESGMYAREHSVLNRQIVLLRNPAKWDELIEINKVPTTLIKKIIESNSLLKLKDDKNKQLAENAQTKEEKEFYLNEVSNYVKEVLVKANSIKVNYITKEGKPDTKTVSLIGGQFDFRYYMDEANDDYRKATIEYYNLFKNTINVFDVIENSPHFKAMVSGVSTIHNTLSLVSAKYNFAFSTSRDIIKDNIEKILDLNNSVLNGRFGNNAFGIKINDLILSRALVTFDKFTISKWLKQTDNDHIRFNAKKLIQTSGIESVIFYKSNNAKNLAIGDIQKNPELYPDDIQVVTPNTDFVIDLKTDYGIANFKILMENVIFEILKKSDSPLAKNLKLSSLRNSIGHWTTQITSTFPINELNSPINIDKFQELLSNFNKVDSTINDNYKIRNAEGRLIKYKDLFYLYNLIVNNESYGDKRLTPLFEDYIKDENTLGYNFLNFYSNVDLGKIKVFDIEMDAQTDEEKTLKNNLEKYLEQDIIFLLLHNKGRLRLEKSGKEIVLKNGNFPINTLIEESTIKDSSKYIITNNILSILKSRNLLINFICD